MSKASTNKAARTRSNFKERFLGNRKKKSVRDPFDGLTVSFEDKDPGLRHFEIERPPSPSLPKS